MTLVVVRRVRFEDVRRLLPDDRGHRVLAVSHCLLDENVRYQGGAARVGVVDEVVVAARAAGCGIYQMPCPEQRAWGGVVRSYVLPAYEAKGTLRYRIRRPLIWLFTMRCRFIYRRLARVVVRDLAGLADAGTQLVAVVGVGPSPTCGVNRTLALPKSVQVLAACRLAETDAHCFAETLLVGAEVDGRGMFMRALERQLRRSNLDPELVEHDLLAELRRAPVRLPV